MAWLSTVARVGVGLCVAACGTSAPEPVCPIDEPGTQWPYCASAMMLALRHSEHLVIQQEEVDFFYELQKPAWTELPILRRTGAQNDDANTPTSFQIQSSYPPLVSPWTAGEVRVGDDVVDRWFGDAGADGVVRRALDHDGLPSFDVHYARMVSWRVLEAGIAEIPETRFQPDHQRPPVGPHVTLAWDGEDAILTFVVAWGDCFVGCATHTWRARVTPEREVTFTDLGGAPVPAEVEQAAIGWPAPL